MPVSVLLFFMACDRGRMLTFHAKTSSDGPTGCLVTHRVNPASGCPGISASASSQVERRYAARLCIVSSSLVLYAIGRSI